MSKYYLIPIVSKYVKINNMFLKDIMKDLDEAIYEREENRLDLIYNIKDNPDKIDEYHKETKRIYDEKNLPEQIAVLEENGLLYEIVTRTEISCDNPNYLLAYQNDPKKIIDLILNDDYSDKANEFIKRVLEQATKKTK